MERSSPLLSMLPDTISPDDAVHALEVLADAKKEIALAEITKKYDFYEKLFAAIFAERSNVTKKLFSIIDKGIKEKDNDLVLAGLSNLSKMVSTSPLASLPSLKKLG